MKEPFWYFSKKALVSVRSLLQPSPKVVTIARKHPKWKQIHFPLQRTVSKDLGGWRLIQIPDTWRIQHVGRGKRLPEPRSLLWKQDRCRVPRLFLCKHVIFDAVDLKRVPGSAAFTEERVGDTGDAFPGINTESHHRGLFSHLWDPHQMGHDQFSSVCGFNLKALIPEPFRVKTCSKDKKMYTRRWGHLHENSHIWVIYPSQLVFCPRAGRFATIPLQQFSCWVSRIDRVEQRNSQDGAANHQVHQVRAEKIVVMLDFH